MLELEFRNEEVARTLREEVAVNEGALHGIERTRTSTGEEVAGMLGIPAPTFAKHLHRAQRKLLAGIYVEP